MEDKETKEKEKFIELQVTENDKVNLLYDKTELKEFFPNLTSEINQGKKSLKISSIEEDIDESENIEIKYEESLSNPGVIDFLRRCSTSEEAMEILEYLNARKELTEDLFILLKERVSEDEGLKKLIDECGGPKKKGYYIDKFYNRSDTI